MFVLLVPFFMLSIFVPSEIARNFLSSQSTSPSRFVHFLSAHGTFSSGASKNGDYWSGFFFWACSMALFYLNYGPWTSANLPSNHISTLWFFLIFMHELKSAISAFLKNCQVDSFIWQPRAINVGYLWVFSLHKVCILSLSSWYVLTIVEYWSNLNSNLLKKFIYSWEQCGLL